MKTQYQLKQPFDLKGAKVETLEFRRLNLGDLRGVENLAALTMKDICHLIGRSANLAPPELDRIDVADLDGIQEIIQGFLVDSQQI